MSEIESTWTYTCYGLILRSVIPLPELGEPAEGADSPDISVEYAELGPVPDDAVVLPTGVWRNPEACGLNVDGIANYQARDGSRLLVDRAPGSDDREVRLFVLGTMLGAIMMQRGYLVLHGMALQLGDGCAVVVGHSGAGKSTLAAEFIRRGFDVLSDDVVPIDREGLALPGYPRIKLWDDALQRLGMESAGLDRITSTHEKFNVPIKRRALSALPVRAVYVLESHDEPFLDLQVAAGIAKFELLSEHTYRGELLVYPENMWEHTQQCAALAKLASVTRLRRPTATMSPADTADAILADLDFDRSRPEGPS